MGNSGESRGKTFCESPRVKSLFWFPCSSCLFLNVALHLLVYQVLLCLLCHTRDSTQVSAAAHKEERSLWPFDSGLLVPLD